MKKRRKFTMACWFFAVYVLSYLGLSCTGYYYCVSFGLTTEHAYRWSPHFFTSTKRFQWNYVALFAYLPLWKLDHLYFHKDVYYGPIPEPRILLKDLLKKENKPDKEAEPTTMRVTDPADAGSAPRMVTAHF